MKIGEAHWTQSSSLYSANTIGAPMHPAPIGVADRTQKITYWRTVPGQLCLLAERDIRAPIYWRTDASPANSISAQKRNTLQAHRVNRVVGFLSGCPNWDPPHPLNRRWVCPPFGTRGGHTCLQERGWVGSQYKGTDTVCTLGIYHVP
jgi:hypothetical protein